MRYYRTAEATGVVAHDGTAAYDLGSARAELGAFYDLVRTAGAIGESIDDVARRHLDAARRVDGDPSDDGVDRYRPLVPAEVWAAGVTYKISEEARTEESDLPDLYVDVYDADRPEVFFKATPSRTVGPGDAVGVRADSDWDVPEPELGVVLYRGDVVGYTIGNDVSSRDIEGQNALYLPQAKVYDRCCSIGPCVVSTGSIDDPHDLEMTLEIDRDGETVVEDATSTGEMVRTCEELASYYTRHNAVPDLAVLLTGTSLVPPDDFTLRPDDVVRIGIEDIGTLTNPVVEV
jgi:2-dehydro-3-deoxy-D-arabinonate dehydratase